jgi:hypothetical protein
MSSLSDILTVAKNVVTAINGMAQTYLNVQGLQNSGSLTAATLVQLGSGRVATVSVTVAGSAVGKIYDANTAASTTNPVYVIPMTVGVIFVNMPVGIGLVVAPGTGQSVTVSYS